MLVVCSQKKASGGVTLVEVMIAAAILGFSAAILTMGANFINNLLRQKSVLEAERDAQIVLYNFSKEIRNAREIISIIQPPGIQTIQFTTYDFSQGFDLRFNPDLFSSNNVLTITYTYRSEEGGFLQKTVDRADGTSIQNQKLLWKMLKPNLNVTGGPGDPMFSPYSPPDAPPPNPAGPYPGVNANFSIEPPLAKGSPRRYKVKSMIRERVIP